LANGQREECSFVRGRDADNNPSPPIILKRRLKAKSNFIDRPHGVMWGGGK
jgi:hypothetical protein